jgi:hypothetical protein
MPLLRLLILSSGVLACAACASGGAAPAAQTAAAPAASADYQREFVYVRGPGDLECPGEIDRARRGGEPSRIFMAEFRCRVNAGWKCPASCRADELLVTHVAVQVDRQGQLPESRVVSKSERADFDEMSVASVRAAVPFPPPPPQLLGAGSAAAFNVELACDCARRK